MLSRMAFMSGLCAHKPWAIKMGTAKAGTQASGPAITAISTKNNTTKGISASTTSEADEKKSRSDSKSRMELANTPTDCGRFSRRMPMISRSSVALMARSAFLPPKSTSRALSQRMMNSSTAANAVPIASVHNEA